MKTFECQRCNNTLTKTNHKTGRIFECKTCELKYVLVITKDKRLAVNIINRSDKEALLEIENSVISDLYNEASTKTKELREKVNSRRARWSHRIILGLSLLASVPFTVVFFSPTVPSKVVFYIGIKTIEILYLFGMAFVYEHQKLADLKKQFAFYYVKKRKLGVMMQEEYLDLLSHEHSLS